MNLLVIIILVYFFNLFFIVRGVYGFGFVLGFILDIFCLVDCKVVFC